MSHPTPDERAADWLIRRDRGLTPAEQDEYLQWLAADPRHGDALARQQETWRELDLLADWRPEHAREPNPALLAPPRRTTRRPLRWVAPVALAAAACAATAFFLNRKPRSAELRASSAAPAIATGYERRVLDDGSILELNRGASVSVAYTPAERRVRLLSGEAHFTVAKNPARPFVVSAAGVETRAVGTAFNVRLGSAVVEVLVTEGKVAVSETIGPALVAEPVRTERDSRGGLPASGRPTFLIAHERVTIPLAPAPTAPTAAVATTDSPSTFTPVTVSADEIALALAWQPRLLEFSAAPLAEVVAEFNRHNTVQLALANPALATLPVTASFRSDNVEGFVRLLEATSGVRAARRGTTIFLRRASSP